MGSFFLMSMPNRRHFLAAAALPAISAHAPVFAQEVFSEGKHYVKVSPTQPTRDPKRVEVLEFFAYSCSHCNAFEPALDAWQKKLSPDGVAPGLGAGPGLQQLLHGRLVFCERLRCHP